MVAEPHFPHCITLHRNSCEIFNAEKQKAKKKSPGIISRSWWFRAEDFVHRRQFWQPSSLQSIKIFHPCFLAIFKFRTAQDQSFQRWIQEMNANLCGVATNASICFSIIYDHTNLIEWWLLFACSNGLFTMFDRFELFRATFCFVLSILFRHVGNTLRHSFGALIFSSLPFFFYFQARFVFASAFGLSTLVSVSWFSCSCFSMPALPRDLSCWLIDEVTTDDWNRVITHRPLPPRQSPFIIRNWPIDFTESDTFSSLIRTIWNQPFGLKTASLSLPSN